MVRYEGLEDFLLHKSNLSEQELEKLEKAKIWRQNNRIHINNYNRTYQIKRNKVDKNFKISIK